jgi:hypothetical protein
MATYREIRMFVECKYGFVPKTSWIAEVKELCDIPHQREAPNRLGTNRTNRCPKERISCIKDALLYFGMIT